MIRKRPAGLPVRSERGGLRRAPLWLVAAFILALAWFLAPDAALAAFYTIHVDSQRNETDAQIEVDRYKSSGLESFYKYDLVQGKGGWYRVFVGMTGSMQEAIDLALKLKQEGRIEYYQIRKMENPVVAVPPPRTAPPEQERGAERLPPPERSKSESRYDTPFKKIVYGRYVASFRDRSQAEAEAEGLTRYGWPASVVEEQNQGTLWYQVYLLPPRGKNYDASVGPGTSSGAPPGMVIVGDMSGSKPGNGHAENKSRCTGHSNFSAKQAIIRRISDAIPPGAYLAGLRELGRGGTTLFEKTIDEFEKPAQAGQNAVYGAGTRLLWGMVAYDRKAFGEAVYQLKAYTGDAPLAVAFRAVRDDFSSVAGRKILVVVSDFRKGRDHPDPVAEARRLKDIYGESLCIFCVYIDADEPGRTLAGEIASVTTCGGVFDGCRLLYDDEYLRSLTDAMFANASGKARPCGDADEDGVCDEDDQCPDTPRGALVDNRGCWMAALGTFFDFDKADVKPQYLPGIRWAADVMKENPGISVELEGHTDNIGTDSYNLGLGMRRAVAVREWLVRFGVKASRVKVRSFGESKPIADNATEPGRGRNRRVEIDVLR